MSQAELHYRKMTETPIEKLIVSLSIPTIISMLISNIYNLADTYFVGTLGVSQSGAIGIVFTLMSILQALGFMCGHGAGSIISRKLADKNVEDASRYISTSLSLALGMGVVFIVLGIPLVRPLMRLLGSTETILPYASTYATYILASAPMMMGSLVLNNVLRYEGKAFYGMIGLTLGGVLNMIGDPLLIYGLGMDVDGAGLSTAVSQTISFFVLLFMFRRHAQSKLSIRYFAKDKHVILGILSAGFPSFMRQGLACISSGMLNNAARLYGADPILGADPCISAMSITSRCQFFMTSIALGFGQGFQPVAGFNYQSRKYSRLRKAFRFTLVAGLCVLIAFSIIGMIFAPHIVRIFQDDPKVVEIGTRSLRFACIAMLFFQLNMVPSMLFQSSGLNGRATLLACLRGGLCFIPLVLILPRMFGLLGVQLSQPMADVLSGICAAPLALQFFRKLPREDGLPHPH